MPEEEEESLVEEEDSLEVEEDLEGDVLEQEELEEEEDSVLPRTVSLRRVSRTTRTYSSMPEYSDSEEETLLKMICWNIFMMHSYQFLSILYRSHCPAHPGDPCAVLRVVPDPIIAGGLLLGHAPPSQTLPIPIPIPVTTLSTQPRDIMDPA